MEGQCRQEGVRLAHWVAHCPVDVPNPMGPPEAVNAKDLQTYSITYGYAICVSPLNEQLEVVGTVESSAFRLNVLLTVWKN